MPSGGSFVSVGVERGREMRVTRRVEERKNEGGMRAERIGISMRRFILRRSLQLLSNTSNNPCSIVIMLQRTIELNMEEVFARASSTW
jgi:hypothetical protein